MTRAQRRYCRSCGAAAPEVGRFCPSCGSSLNITTPYPAPSNVRDARDPRDVLTPRSKLDAIEPPLPSSVVTPTVGGSVRMGFGIALGMMLFALVAMALILVVTAIGSGAITWPFAERGQRFDGIGSVDSAPIALDGRYRIEWSASPTSPDACMFSAALRADSSPTVDVEIARTMISASLAPGLPLEVDLARRSDYYLRVDSGCTWSIRVVEP